MATAILLDCDPGHDDAIALLLALASPELELVGVTTVAGNQTLEKTTANAIRILEFVGRDDVPVAAGAAAPLVRELSVAAHVHGDSGLDGYDLPPPRREPLQQHAVEFLAEQIRARDGAVTLVPTGPLTNVASLLATHPDARPERIVLMGGAIAEGNITPLAEFNIWVDPEAAARVFASGIDVTMVGLDVTHKALFTAAHEQRLEGRVGELIRGLLRFYGAFHRRRYGWDGSPIHDAVAVAYVARGELLDTVDCTVDVDTGPEPGRGRTSVDVGRRSGRRPDARAAVDIRAREFLDLLVARLNSFAPARAAPTQPPRSGSSSSGG